MTRAEAVRLVAALAQCEMALVRNDSVAGPLLAQAARAAEGLAPGPLVAAAARLARGLDPAGDAPTAGAARRVAQALCRAAAQGVQAELLAPEADG